MAVNVLSPPDNREIFLSFLPEGSAFISIPVFKISLGSVNTSSALPPLNRSLNTFLNSIRTCSNVSVNLVFITSSISLIISNKVFSALASSSCSFNKKLYLSLILSYSSILPKLTSPIKDNCSFKFLTLSRAISLSISSI